ncbi:MAG: ShlB/FhaC/HecB family hemolysin secretion/activation protein [Planctomycetes bacterium]|nr:ShlB/FhaC/HecB family hemolysin secretion/activation protein [Planctomycetota bacterium]
MAPSETLMGAGIAGRTVSTARPRAILFPLEKAPRANLALDALSPARRGRRSGPPGRTGLQLAVLLILMSFGVARAEEPVQDNAVKQDLRQLREELEQLRKATREREEQLLQQINLLRGELLQLQDHVARGMPPKKRLAVTGFNVQGSTLPKQVLDVVLDPLTEKRLTVEELTQEVNRLLKEAYNAMGIRGIQVTIPPQPITDAPIVLQVDEPRLGKIQVRGNRFFGEKNIARFFEDKIATPEGILQAGKLEQQLDRINRHPDRQVTALMQSGTEAGTIDLAFNVNERKALHGLSPFHYAAEVNNEGTPNTGRLRVQHIFQYTNVFDRDQTATLQWLFNPEDFNTVQVIGGSYQVPIGTTDHSFVLYGGYSAVETAAVLEALAITGGGYTTGAQFSYTLPKFWEIQSSVSLAMEYIQLNNSLEFGTFSAIESDVGILPVIFRYSLLRRDDSGSTLGNFSIRYNIEGVAPHGELEDFREFREEATSSFITFRGGLERYHALPRDFSLHIRFEGQYSPENLIPAEQFRLGGFDTIRGYEESELSGDRGLFVRTELLSPRLPPLISSFYKTRENLQALLFIDWGFARLSDPLEGEPQTTEIGGTGVGLRYQLTEYFLGRIDLGWALYDASITKTGDTSVHFSAELSF